MEPQKISPDALNAAWVDNQLEVQRVEVTTGRDLAGIERNIAQLRDHLAQAEARRQDLTAVYARDMAGPHVQLRALALLATDQKLPHPQDPPPPAQCACGQPIGKGVAGWVHLVTRTAECSPGEPLSQRATPAHEGDQRVAGADRTTPDRGAK